MAGRNRREILKAGVGVLGASTGLGAGLKAPGTDSEPKPGALVLRLSGADARAHVHGAQAARLPRPNDQLHVHGTIADTTGAPAGTFTATGVVVRTPFNNANAIVEQHLFVLGDGTITGSGQRAGTAGNFAVTGGTGRYAGARGSYAAHIDAVGAGGAGTTHFDFSLSI